MQRRISISVSKLLLEHSLHRPLTTTIASKSITTTASSFRTSAATSPEPSIPWTRPICDFRLPRNSSSSSSPHRQFLRHYGVEAKGEVDVNKAVDEINLKFAEAREEIEAAMESKETVYFNEEAEIARAAANEVVELFEGLLGKVEEGERASLQRSMGLKIEQLKAELQQLNE